MALAYSARLEAVQGEATGVEAFMRSRRGRDSRTAQVWKLDSVAGSGMRGALRRQHGSDAQLADYFFLQTTGSAVTWSEIGFI